MARSCDLCKSLAPDARQFDLVVPSILKATRLHSEISNTILDKLKINTSVVNRKPTYGDVCKDCEKKLGVEINKIIDDGVKLIADKIGEVGKRTTDVIKTQEIMNQEFFEKMTSDWRGVRPQG